MRLSPLRLLALSFALVVTSGCDSELELACNNLFSAIGRLQPLHVAARAEFDPRAFVAAQVELLKAHQIAIPSTIPASSLQQCKGTFQLALKASPKTQVQDFAIELLNSYAHQWDPHSTAMSEEDLAREGAFSTGYGFRVERSRAPNRVEIVDVIGGSPAHTAGLQEGMAIRAVNGRDVRDISASELAALLGDRASRRLTLSIFKPRREVTLYRETFEASPIKYQMLDSTGYVKLRKLDGALAIFAEALKTLHSADALILDLRDIAGGSVQAAADIGDLLISNGDTFVGFLGRGMRPEKPVKMRDLGSVWDGPIVVLVNSGTKSAAEMLAGALQDYGALVVGHPTFGKGTRQLLMPLTDFGLSAGIYVTDAFAVRPSGKIIQFHGVAPDIALPMAEPMKRESSYAKALPPPPGQKPLEGYDPSILPARASALSQRLRELQEELGALASGQGPSSAQDDLLLQAARRAAILLAKESEDEPR